uniref:Tr-type G domain-containing protein n=1 Tax=Kalanchoe fedtschenkoi TaxID=63787 RepID=A0A7N1A0I2_KALFE
MPRKLSYNIDYDDIWDEDDDYGDDYYEEEDSSTSYHARKVGQQPEAFQGSSRREVWRCHICTYDNEEGMNSCDMCGCLRYPLVKPSNKKDEESVPFQFDTPSPDDVVSSGLTSKKTFQGNNVKAPTNDKKTSKSSTANDKKTSESLEATVKKTNKSSASVTKGKPDTKGKRTDSVDEIGGKNVTSQMNNVTLADKAETSKYEKVNAQKATSLEKYTPEKWVTPEEDEDNLTPLNLAIVGHVDSGKSTLSGRLLYLSGRISEKQMHKFKKEANQEGKGSFAYAWAMDESAEERERGVTMTVAVAYFDTKRYNVVLLDAPGHKDFVPNMISGATQADAAILVVDASIGAFEAGMENASGHGQTKEHAQLIRSFGVDQLIVAVNKMDVVNYSKERFDMIKTQIGTFLRSCGFKDSCITWIPISAMENENLAAAASDARLISWYKGPYLLDAIDTLKPPTRDLSSPLLMPICDVSRSASGQTTISGKLEAGALRVGLKVLIMPIRVVATVRSLERDSRSCKIARAGENVAVTVQGIEGGYVMPGGVICQPEYPISVSNHLELKILVLNIVTPILMGSQVEFHIHHVKEAAVVSRIVSVLDSKTGKVTRKSPRCLVAKQSAVVEVLLSQAICVEEFSKCRALGRVFLRSSGTTLAVGVVSRVMGD